MADKRIVDLETTTSTVNGFVAIDNAANGTKKITPESLTANKADKNMSNVSAIDIINALHLETEIDESSTDLQVPSAKAVVDAIAAGGGGGGGYSTSTQHVGLPEGCEWLEVNGNGCSYSGDEEPTYVEFADTDFSIIEITEFSDVSSDFYIGRFPESNISFSDVYQFDLIKTPFGVFARMHIDMAGGYGSSWYKYIDSVYPYDEVEWYPIWDGNNLSFDKDENNKLASVYINGSEISVQIGLPTQECSNANYVSKTGVYATTSSTSNIPTTQTYGVLASFIRNEDLPGYGLIQLWSDNSADGSLWFRNYDGVGRQFSSWIELTGGSSSSVTIIDDYTDINLSADDTTVPGTYSAEQRIRQGNLVHDSVGIKICEPYPDGGGVSCLRLHQRLYNETLTEGNEYTAQFTINLNDGSYEFPDYSGVFGQILFGTFWLTDYSNDTTRSCQFSSQIIRVLTENSPTVLIQFSVIAPMNISNGIIDIEFNGYCRLDED